MKKKYKWGILAPGKCQQSLQEDLNCLKMLNYMQSDHAILSRAEKFADEYRI